ncbi:MAG: hypothetical protein AAB289_13940 [Chloroflexota bacterium]
MAKEKVTITLDRSKAGQARLLLGATSTSQAVDLPLDRVIHLERLRRDIAGYRQVPPTREGLDLALLSATVLDDAACWETRYPAENQ